MRRLLFYVFLGLALWGNPCGLKAQSSGSDADTLLNPASMIRDLHIMQASWQVVHGGLYRYISPQALDSAFAQLNRRCNQPMPLKEYFVLLAQLNIRLNCGHSFVSHYNNKRTLKAKLYARTFLPLLFKMIEGKMVVTHVLDSTLPIKAGDVITSLNNVSADLIRDSLLSLSKADGNHGLNKKLDNISLHPQDMSPKRYTLFDIYYPLLFRKNLHENATSLTFKRGKASQQLWVKNLSKEERFARLISIYGSIPQGQDTWFLKRISTETALFRVGDFATYNWKFNFRSFLDSVFLMLKKEKVKHLIVDIRQNEGGADDARDAVLTYLTPRNLGPANAVRRLYRYTQVPDSLKPFMDTWDPGFLQPKQGFQAVGNGYFEREKSNETFDSIVSSPHYFRGKIYLLTDVTNSSATFIMADCFKRNHLGTIVGETTGGSRQGINGGELVFLYLPETGIEMDVPLIWQRPFTSQPDEGIIPDYIVPTTIQSVQKREDVQLNFVLNRLIKKK